MVEGSRFDQTPPEQLAKLFGAEPHAPAAWSMQEVEAIYRHQLATPLKVELAGLQPEDALRLSTVAEAQGLLLRSIGDLLHHSHPPLMLLTMLKDFAKRLMEHPDSPLPREVASLLYWSAIAAGLTRAKTRLTSLDDGRLREGFRWAMSQPWLDAPTAEMLRLADSGLSAGAGA